MNRMIDPRLLRALVGVIDHGSFTRAAEQLNMSQSTISQQISRLEDQLGQPLLDRDARPVRMTAAGERLTGYARRILALQDEATLALGDPSGSVSLRIGLAEDIMTPDMARLFADFAATHRRVRADVTAPRLALTRSAVSRRRFRTSSWFRRRDRAQPTAAPASPNPSAGSRGRAPPTHPIRCPS